MQFVRIDPGQLLDHLPHVIPRILLKKAGAVRTDMLTGPEYNTHFGAIILTTIVAPRASGCLKTSLTVSMRILNILQDLPRLAIPRWTRVHMRTCIGYGSLRHILRMEAVGYASYHLYAKITYHAFAHFLGSTTEQFILEGLQLLRPCRATCSKNQRLSTHLQRYDVLRQLRTRNALPPGKDLLMRQFPP